MIQASNGLENVESVKIDINAIWNESIEASKSPSPAGAREEPASFGARSRNRAVGGSGSSKDEDPRIAAIGSERMRNRTGRGSGNLPADRERMRSIIC